MPMWRKVTQQEFLDMLGGHLDVCSGDVVLSDGVVVSGSLLRGLPYIVDSLDDDLLAWLPREIVVAMYEPWEPCNSTELLLELLKRCPDVFPSETG